MKFLLRGMIAILCISATWYQASGQQPVSPISTMIEENKEALEKAPVFNLMKPSDKFTVLNEQVKSYLNQAFFFEVDFTSLQQMLLEKQPFVKMEILWFDGKEKTLLLTKANVFSDEFAMYSSSDRKTPLDFHPGEHYWGVVEGEKGSVAAISLFENEIAGMIQIGTQNYTLGKMENQASPVFILYQDDQLKTDFEFSCYTDADEEYFIEDTDPDFEGEMKSDGQKCIKMYIEVDYDITVGKGSANNAANYVTSLFSQVAILYANDGISVLLHELVVWDVVDPYTGPSTSNYLSQFRNHLNGVYNGDLAHLIGYNGGGGIAYLNVICSSLNGVGYSAINSSFNNVPTYSWSVMVVAHEIGHNLGAWHTHDCRWNGNNTPIDCCGPNAGYAGSNCTSGYNCTIPNPSGGGTIMSYCHATSVGINFNHGFGPQPTARMMNRIDAATCLTICEDTDPEPDPDVHDAGITQVLEPSGEICETSANPVVVLKNFGNVTLTQVNIKSQLNSGPIADYLWQGSLAANATVQVTLPVIGFSEGNHTLTVLTQNPNNQPDQNNSNNSSNASFSLDLGDCICIESTSNFPNNPLTHSGSGSSSTSVTLETGSKNAEFTVSNMTAVTNGSRNNRYIDQVEITYVNGNNQSVLYGVFTGDQQNAVQVNIDGFVNAITVNLSNGHSGSYNGTLSVNLSNIEYCAGDGDGGCADSDGDGVCDEDDICPGFDDNLIGTPCNDGDPCTENDVYTVNCFCEGTPIPGCDDPDCNDSDGDGVCDEDDICPGFDDNLIGTPCDDGDSCTENDVYTINCICEGTIIPDCGDPDCQVTYSFLINPLTHSGTGASTSYLELDPGSTEVSFTVTGLSSITNGPPIRRYIDQVTIEYVNGNGTTVHYGTFYGNVVNSVQVDIEEEVASLTVSLQDAWDGDASLLMVQMSEVTACVQTGSLKNPKTPIISTVNSITVHPNPANSELHINWLETVSVKSKIIVYNSIGMQIASYDMDLAQHMKLNISDWTNVSNIVFIKVIPEGMEPITKSVMILK